MIQRFEDKGNRRIQGQTGKATCGDKVRSKASMVVQLRSARRRANDLGNGSQLEKRASDRSRPDNECDMCSEKAARVQLRLGCRGGNLPRCMQAEETGGPSWRSNPPAASFQLRWQLAFVCQTTLALWLDKGTSTPNPTKVLSPPCKALSNAHRLF